MFSQIIGFISTVLKWGINLFIQILTQTGMMGAFLAVFAIICIARFILMPLLGNGMSKGTTKEKDKD